jgi:hypothetical protein
VVRRKADEIGAAEKYLARVPLQIGHSALMKHAPRLVILVAVFVPALH